MQHCISVQWTQTVYLVSFMTYSESKFWRFAGIMTFDLLKVKMLNWLQVSHIFTLALANALPISYCASKSVHPFGFCRYIFSWKSNCSKLCLKKHGENLKIFFPFEIPQLRHPSTEWTQKVLGTTIFTPEHVCEISFRLLNIFEKLWRSERIALNWEEEKQKKTKKEVRIIFWRARFGVKYLQ